MTTNPIQRAVEIAGGNAALARLLNTKPSLVSQWVTGRRPVAAHWGRKIEDATDGAVTRCELRPDVFGEPAQHEAA
ncbi:MAG: helix-turn-helix domain-containing protein [Betaproteobacteria bacterium]|nr:helix-turn-helix domain-containing protein [Betaproteobacteria bacterium]